MTAAFLVSATQAWLLIGSLIGIVFVAVGIDRIDEDARGAYAFRPLLLLGCALIWPLVLWRWWILESGRDKWPNRHKPHRAAHFTVAIVFAISIPAIIIAGLTVKQVWPESFVPQKLSNHEIEHRDADPV
ncbi:MAG: hypothetical protein AAF412_01370 [Pseudomonadota bacterium]